MTTAAKRAGAKYETDVLQYLREAGLNAERLAKAGSLDEGDIVLTDGEGSVYVLELKARRDRTTSLSLGAWLGEAAAESLHYAAARSLGAPPAGILVVKRPNRPIGESFVVMTLQEFIDG